jgi:hypothetical protein
LGYSHLLSLRGQNLTQATPTVPFALLNIKPQLGVEPALVEPLPALLACARRLAALQTPDGGSEGGCGADGSDATTMSVGMASQLMRVELGCESSKALQVCVSVCHFL